MSIICNECRAKVPDGTMTCPSCGMPLKNALEKVAFAHEWQAFVDGERMLHERLESRQTRTKAAQQKVRDHLARLQLEWKNLLIRMSNAGVRANDLKLPKENPPANTPAPACKRSKKTESHGSTLTVYREKSTQFIDGHIKISPDKFHIWFANVGWYEVKPNCSWDVLDRILDQSRNKPEYQKAPFVFSFSRRDGLALRKAVAVKKGNGGTWPRLKKQIPLPTAILDKNPGCEARNKVTTAQFKELIYKQPVNDPPERIGKATHA